MLRAYLSVPASSRGPYDDTTTVTQGVVVYNLTYDRQETAVILVRLPESGYPAGAYAAAKRHAKDHYSGPDASRLRQTFLGLLRSC